MKKIILITVLMLSACAGLSQVDENYKHEFTYNYAVPGKTQKELWMAANNFMALTYSDSTKVIKVADEQAGILIGTGIIGWKFSSLSAETCNYNYSIKFAAKDGKARLQFDLLNPVGGCGWDRPSEDGYKQIEFEFNALNENLGVKLNSDSTKIFKDF